VRALAAGGIYLGVLALLGRIPVELREAFLRRGQ
jgi:hypothetical protein